jgi:hypothetical protein
MYREPRSGVGVRNFKKTTLNKQAHLFEQSQTTGGKAMSMQPQERRLSAYAPMNSSLSAYAPVNSSPLVAPKLRLASAAIQAVDQLGVATSDEIEKTAEEIMRGATEIVDRLRELAKAIRQHNEIANEHVAGFCCKATSVFEAVIELQATLRVNGHEPAAEETDHATLSLPEFMKKGPAEPDDDELKSAFAALRFS